MEKATGNHSIMFPKNACQFTDNKQTESVENNDHLYPEGTWHLKDEKI